MSSGYVLNVSSRQFIQLFEDLGIDLQKHAPAGGSKANLLRQFLRSAPAYLLVQVLEALLDLHSTRDDSRVRASMPQYLAMLERLKAFSPLDVAASKTELLILAYVEEMQAKTDRSFVAGDFEAAVTTARTVLEAVLEELHLTLLGCAATHSGDLQVLYKAVSKQLGADDKREVLDEHFKTVARGLVQIVAGLSPLRNAMSDAHPRKAKPQPHHARAIVNASKTVTAFLIESYVYQSSLGRFEGATKVQS